MYTIWCAHRTRTNCQVLFDFYFADISEASKARHTESSPRQQMRADEDEGIFCASVHG